MAAGRGPATSAEFHRVRHEAAKKAWLKRKRGGGEGPAAPRARAAAAGGGVQLAGNSPPTPIPLEGIGRADWRLRGPLPSRGDFAGAKEREFARVEEQLRGQQKSSKNLGGGVSASFVVELVDGTRGNFKSAIGESRMRRGVAVGQQTEREIAAWDVAKCVGMDDMVAPVVARECAVPACRAYKGTIPAGTYAGCFLRWQEGAPAKFISDRDPKKYDGDHDLQRAAMFDFVIGNMDRHDGNWVVGDSSGKLRLIDHGLSFSEGPTYGNDYFKAQVYAQFSGGDYNLKEFAAPYIQNKQRIVNVLIKRGLPQAAVDRVAARIDAMSSWENWSQMESHVEPNMSTSLSARDRRLRHAGR